MGKICTDLMQDASEIVHYDKTGIPLYIKTGNLEDYPDKRALCHWHEDLEFIYIEKGKMNYRINNKKILLKEADCLMVNTRQMHYGYSYNNQDCIFTCILFHPQLFTPNQVLAKEHIVPFLENSGLEFLSFNRQDCHSVKILEFLDQIVCLKKTSLPGYEIAIIGIMHLLWYHLLQYPPFLAARPESTPDFNLSIQRDMVSFIYQNYSEKLTLSDIANSGSVSRNKCCSIFKTYLQQSPIDFLNHYRLEISCHLLKNSSFPITQIATTCGFNHLSYYSKLFSQNYGCTPKEYRKMHHR